MGTSPELRVHPLREILAPRPGMRFHACHTARAASDETDATTRDGGAMDASFTGVFPVCLRAGQVGRSGLC